MQKRTREIIALVILLVLLVGGICGVAWYLLVGHNWNAAASLIDDHIGTMEGYNVVLCEGAPPHAESANDPEEDAEGDGGAGIVEFAAGMPAALVENGFGYVVEGRLTAEKVSKAYRAKGALTVLVDIDDAASYSDPVIVPRNGQRIAIYSVKGPHQELASRMALRNIKKYDVDCTICLFDDIEALEEYGLGDVTIGICLDRTAHVRGEYIGSTFTISAPNYGQVEAVIVSPSGFLLSKTIGEL